MDICLGERKIFTAPASFPMSSQQPVGISRPTLEEEKRRELVLQSLRECGVTQYDADVVDTLTRWIAQESKAANQDKRAELLSKDISPDAVSKLILESLGVYSNSSN